MISRYSIAVLPFSDEQSEGGARHFCEGIATEIIHSLSACEGLQVTSRNSSFRFSITEHAFEEISLKLGVAFLLDGSVIVEEEKVRISAQLLRADDGFLVWSGRWREEFRNLLDLQARIAGEIAGKINSNIGPHATAREDRQVEPEALEAYMKGQYLLNRMDSSRWQEIIGHFENAIRLDPGFTNPMVGLCNSYTWLSSIGELPPAEARQRIDDLIDRLFSMNRNIADVYQLVAEKSFWIEWRTRESLKHIERALELRPSNSAALVTKGLACASLGDLDESFEALFRAERIHPYGENVKYVIGLVYHYSGDHEKALGYIKENLEISPQWLAPYLTKIEALCSLERFREAREFIRENREIPGFAGMMPVFNGLVAAYSGNIEATLEASHMLQQAMQNNPFSSPLHYHLALFSLKLGDKDAALRWLSEGLEKKASPLLFLRIDRTWDPVRSDSGFNRILEESGLPVKEQVDTAAKARYRKAPLPDEQARVLGEKLGDLMETDQVFLNPKIGLADLAEMCGISTNLLSRYLNSHLGSTYFDYVNRFRLKYFLSISRRREFDHLSILGKAYESGFNSKTTFNTFFRKETGKTPREYLSNMLSDETDENKIR